MIILNCPHCSEPVTASPGMRATARVKCPLCLTEYTLAEALEKLPPALIALDEPAGDGSGEPQLEPTWDARGGGEATSGAAWMTSDPAAVGTAGPRLVTRARPKRPAKSPLVEVIKVVAGGVAGLVIAVLVLWWFPVERLRRDPLQLGPKIGAIPWLKFIVPVGFRPKALSNDDADSESTRVPTRGSSGGGLFGAGNGSVPTENSSGTTTLGGQVDWNEVLKSKQELSDPTPAKPTAKRPAVTTPKAAPKTQLTDDQPPLVDDRDDAKGTAKDSPNLQLDLQDPVKKSTPTKPASSGAKTSSGESAPAKANPPPRETADEPASSNEATEEPPKPTDKPATPDDSSPTKPADKSPAASDSPAAKPT